MSGSLPQLQEQAATRADEFCARYGRPRRKRGSKGDGGWSDDSVFKRTGSAVEKFYRGPYTRTVDTSVSLQEMSHVGVAY